MRAIVIGTKVAALMGGLGRSINGSYAEYTPSACGFQRMDLGPNLREDPTKEITRAGPRFWQASHPK
jgi:hypothetical protein